MEIIPSLVQGAPDIDAISEKFFVMKRGPGKASKVAVNTFQRGDIDIQVEISLQTYNAILDHVDEVNARDEEQVSF